MACYSRAGGHLGGVLMGSTREGFSQHTHHPRAEADTGGLTSALLGSSLWNLEPKSTSVSLHVLILQIKFIEYVAS